VTYILLDVKVANKVHFCFSSESGINARGLFAPLCSVALVGDLESSFTFSTFVS